jgi:mRNA-degrading endonuclease RelE of RelBE toxin-antitoxin system
LKSLTTAGWSLHGLIGYNRHGIVGGDVMWQVQLTTAAQETLQTLSEDHRREVLEAIGRLTLGPHPPGIPQPYRLRNRPELIILGAGDRYRIAFAVAHEERRITVIDVVAAHRSLAGYPTAGAAS